MAEAVGELLKQLRTANGWTLGKLAQVSGVSKSALSQWETDKRQPRMVELDAVLEALQVSASQRSLLYARIDAPRALRRLRQQERGSSLVAPPMAGDLIRGMRLRKHWSQERLASAVGVDRTSVLRWEQGERLPDTARVQQLCYVLEAQEEELLALTQGNFLASDPILSSSCWRKQEQMLHERFIELLWKGEELLTLRWLALEYDLWQLAMQHDSVKPLLVRILIGHARHNRNQEHWGETEMRVQKAFALIPPPQIELETRLQAVVMQTAAQVHTGSHLAPQRGMEALQQWLPHSTKPTFTAWMLSDMADYAAMMQWSDAGLALAKQACEITERGDSLTEAFLRRHDYGRLLLDAGRWAEALTFLVPLEKANKETQIAVRLLMMEAHRRLGHHAEEHAILQQAFDFADSHRDRELWRSKIASAVEQFQ